MTLPNRETEVPDILNEWDPTASWRIVKDTSDKFVFMNLPQGRLYTDLAVARKFLTRMVGWGGLSERVEEAGATNIVRLLQALQVLLRDVEEAE